MGYLSPLSVARSFGGHSTHLSRNKLNSKRAVCKANRGHI